MSRFTELKIKEIIRETSDANTIVFFKPAGEEWNYLPGQYLTLKLDINGESVRRAYSLCSSPYTDQDLAVTVKRVSGGRVSNYIPDHLKAGDVIEVFPPIGNFTVKIDPAKSRHYVLLGGGSGITPLMSIIKSVLLQEKNSRITLIYGNRDADSIIFRQTLDELQAVNPDRLKILYAVDQPDASWTGIRGVLTRHQLLGILNDIMNADNLPKTFHICGPTGMMEEVQAALSFYAIPKDQIFRELFTAALPDPEEKVKVVYSGEGKRDTYTVRITLDGETKDVVVDQDSSILDAAIDAGMDPPYACQMGVCCTCRAKLTSGKVEMDEDEGLSDTEIEDGFILTCQSHPLTPDCELEYM